MLARIIFYVSVSAAILAVILLATISPLPKTSHKICTANYNWATFPLYIQSYSPNPTHHDQLGTQINSVYVFRYRLTAGPENGSEVIGNLYGFVQPVHSSMLSSFNIVHLALFRVFELSGSLSIESRQGRRGEELIIVGGTGSFAYAIGDAVLLHVAGSQSFNDDSGYLIKLRIGLPDRDQNIPGRY